mmetsp:Transcript_36402/g.42497  ORF Transcript_36402/g.42497 Transcript_36402/m.42497 type:complete len:188 (-) Transcript_36402:3-566(-)
MSAVPALVERPTKADTPVAGLMLKVLNDARILERIKVMDKVNFPVTYSEKYYSALVEAGWHNFSIIAYYHELLVGSATCRLETTAVDGQFRLYVMTIAVLPAYRNLSIGTKMMQKIIDNVANETSVAISEIALHVQVGSSALEFYKKFGFAIKEEVKEYYKDLAVRDALLLTRVVPQLQLAKKTSKK